jgi:hypothetical protein
MNVRTSWVGAAVATLVLLGTAGAARAQAPPAHVIGARLPNGGYTVVIGPDTMVAFPDSILRKLLAMQTDLKTEKEVTARLQQVVDLHEKEVQQVDRLSAVQRDLITAQDAQIADLRKEADILNKLRNGGWLSVELGAGASGGDTEPGLVAGLAIRRLRVWGLLQKSNSGAFMGFNLPVF